MKPLTVSKLAIGDLKALLQKLLSVFLKLNLFVWFFVGFGYLAKQFAQFKVLQKLNIARGCISRQPAWASMTQCRPIRIRIRPTAEMWVSDNLIELLMLFFCSGPRSSWKAGFSQRHRENQLSGFGCRANQLAGLRFGKNKLPGFDWRQEQLPVLSKVRNVKMAFDLDLNPTLKELQPSTSWWRQEGKQPHPQVHFFAKLENLQLPFVLDQNISFRFYRFFTLFSKLFNLYKNDSG